MFLPLAQEPSVKSGTVELFTDAQSAIASDQPSPSPPDTAVVRQRPVPPPVSLFIRPWVYSWMTMSLSRSSSWLVGLYVTVRLSSIRKDRLTLTLKPFHRYILMRRQIICISTSSNIHTFQAPFKFSVTLMGHSSLCGMSEADRTKAW